MKLRSNFGDRASFGVTELTDCPLCGGDAVVPFVQAHGRSYHECATCRLVYMAPGDRLGLAAEIAHYATHRNDPADAGYRRFLSRVADPLVEVLSPGSEGLDYGCGPGPTLSRMLRERGHRVECYDPVFNADESVLGRSYDFITCTETAEHFFRPHEEFDRLNRLLRPGGWLALMTELLSEEREFTQWRYARDPTHVCFYRRETLEWIGERYGWSPRFPHPTVVIFRKPLAGA